MSDILLNAGTHDVLDENGNFIGNDLALVTGSEEVAQRLRQNFKFFLGEWMLDTRKGVPYYEQILGKGKNPVIIDSILKSVIAQTPGVVELKEFSLDVDDSRNLTLTFKARVSEGEEVEVSITL